MRPVTEVPAAFSSLDEGPETRLPLLDRWVEGFRGAEPFAGWTVLLVQHQLSNHGAQAEAIVRLGADPRRMFLLDIPYTSHEQVRAYLQSALHIPPAHFCTCDDYRVLQPYAPYQLRRSVEMLVRLAEIPGPLVVLDDGAYVLAALAVLRKERWPRELVIVEQTTRGMIKLSASAAMRLAASQLALVDVARSSPKRTLEPPFIAMSVCASLKRLIEHKLDTRAIRRCLILGYGAIGEQVATFVSHQLGLDRAAVFVCDPDRAATTLAARRGFSCWDREDFATRFDLVVGCSGRSSFGVGDYVYLNDGAVLASASSGAVELSRRGLVERADASPIDDLEVIREGLDEADLHSDIRLRLVDREVSILNAGFPINFDGRLSTTPGKYIQPTPVMMIGGALQAMASRATPGMFELDRELCDWLAREFRAELGADVHLLDPPAENAW